MSDHAPPFRVLPRVTEVNEHFWRGGSDGELRFLRCQDCGYWIHPPGPRCPACLGANLSPEAVSGEATVFSFTINVQDWGLPTYEPPYVIAIVELPEQAGLRLTTNIVGCAPDAVTIGMPVRVVFEHHDDRGYEVWVPLFEPVGAEP